jgi:hypothetical protein
MDEILVDDKKFISSRRASAITGYAQDYIGQLCRGEKITAKRIGRAWYVSEEELLTYQSSEKYRKDFVAETTIETENPVADPAQEVHIPVESLDSASAGVNIEISDIMAERNIQDAPNADDIEQPSNVRHVDDAPLLPPLKGREVGTGMYRNTESYKRIDSWSGVESSHIQAGHREHRDVVVPALRVYPTRAKRLIQQVVLVGMVIFAGMVLLTTSALVRTDVVTPGGVLTSNLSLFHDNFVESIISLVLQ